MFEWLKGKPKEKKEHTPYVNPYKHGDRVELVWTLYNEGGYPCFRLMDADEENRKQNPDKPTWDIFSIVIEKGKAGIVTGTIRDSVIVQFEGFPFGVIVIESGLRRLA